MRRDFRHFGRRADCQQHLPPGKIDLVGRHGGQEQPFTARLRRLESDPVHTFDKQVGHRRTAIRQPDEESPFHCRQLIDSYRRPAGTVSVFVAAPWHHGGILRHRLGMGTWQRLSFGEPQVKRRRQRHTDIGTGKRLEFCRNLHRRTGNMAAHIERQDHRVLVTEIVETESIEPFWHRPGEPALKPWRGALRQIDNRRKACLARGAPVDLPTRRENEFHPQRQHIQVTHCGHRRDEARLANRRVALPW